MRQCTSFEEFPALGAWFARLSVQPATAEIAESLL